MTTLLQHYTIDEIFIFIVFLAFAIKSLISFYDWVLERFNKVFNKEHRKLNKREQLEKQLQDNKQMISTLQKNQQRIDKKIQDLSKKIDTLISSDKDAIKSYITQKHHFFCYEQEWIDDFSLDCIERRYQHYKEEGGNTFIDGFMGELRQLPKGSPQRQNNKEE